jgi:hypothetical protein
MKRSFISLVALVILTTSCKNEVGGPIPLISNRDEEQLESLLVSLCFPPQVFVIDSKSRTEIRGEHGTVIDFNSSAIETIDGIPIGDSIRVELLELPNNLEMVMHNVQTVSDNGLLVSGGAYYLMMYSNNTALRIKEGEFIDIEFPRFTDDEMTLFLGERDSTGQMVWTDTDQKFESKNIEPLDEPKIPEVEEKKAQDLLLQKEPAASTYNPRESEIVFEPVDDDYEMAAASYRKKLEGGEEISEKEYNDYLRKKAEYEKRVEELREQEMKYNAVSLLNLGWINCDRFYGLNVPLTNIELYIKQETIQCAWFYAIFMDINSLMIRGYSSKDRMVLFQGIPANRNVKFVGLAIRDSVYYWFERDLITKNDQKILVEFEISSFEEIHQRFAEIK